MFEEKDIVYKIIIASFAMPILLSILLTWFFITYQKRRNQYLLSLKEEELKRQKLIIQQQKTLEAERNRIAAEMHDDIGGGLTSIQFLSQNILRNAQDPAQKRIMEKIATNAKALVGNMSEIIWAMNSGFDTVENLIAYTRRYSYEYLEDYNIDIHFEVVGTDQNQQCSGEQRRNIFLIFKEALHNTVKHSQADKVSIEFITSIHRLEISIKDNGIGLNSEDNQLGNGLRSIKNRIKNIGGEIDFSNKNGLEINISLPIPNKSYIT